MLPKYGYLGDPHLSILPEPVASERQLQFNRRLLFWASIEWTVGQKKNSNITSTRFLSRNSHGSKAG